MLTNRFFKLGATLAALNALGACADHAATSPNFGAARAVRLSLSAEVNAAAAAMRVSVGYRRTGSTATIVLTETRIVVGSDARAVPVTIDIAPCLGDEQHEVASSSTGTPACILYVTAILLDASNQTLDQTTTPGMTVRPGDAPFAAVSLGTRGSFVALAPARFMTCRALKTSGGGTTCWGSARTSPTESFPVTGQTPLGNAPDFVQLVAGDAFVCGLSIAGATSCWGRSASGVLNSIPDASRATPSLITSAPVFTQVVAAFSAACGLTTTGLAYCWGNNQFGQLGDGTLTQRIVPAPVRGDIRFKRLASGATSNTVCGLTEGGPVYCWGTFGLVFPTPAAVAAGPQSLGVASAGIASVTLGNDHACGIAFDGTTACYGTNTQGQLGDGTTTPRSSFALVSGGLRFQTLTAGFGFTCGLTAEGLAYCWGQNDLGQLGDGTTTRKLVPTRVATSVVFSTIVAGTGHVCGATSSGAVFCWGANATGQVGDGTTIDRLLPTAVR